MEAVMSIRFKNLAGVAATAAFFLLGQQAVAQQQRAWCDPCWNLCGDWEVGAHALYYVPITCPYAYADTTVSTTVAPLTTTVGSADVIPCRAEWGFRVFGNYLQDCFFAGVSYQWIDLSTTRSITGTVQIQGSLNPLQGAATGRVNIEYQNVDVRLGQYFLRGCGSSLYLYGNARWVDLSHRRSSQAVNTAGNAESVQEKSQLEGGALGIGFGGEVDIWCDFGAFIDGNLLGVIGSRSLKDVRFRSFTPPNVIEDFVERYPSETCVIPEVDFRIGLNYSYQCGCWALVGEIGYEVDYFWHASVFPDVTSSLIATDPRDFVPTCEDLGFSGLFFGARLIF